MGYIEYLEGDLDTNGNKTWYYKFFSDNHKVDVTEHFTMIGRKVKLKYITMILSRHSPEDVYNIFNKTVHFKFYTLPGSAQAQKAIDKCNKGQGCHAYCTANHIWNECAIIAKHSKLVETNRYVNEAIRSPKENYICKGTKKGYIKKTANKKLNYKTYEEMNNLTKQSNTEHYTIQQIVNEGNTCEIVSATDPTKKMVIDVVFVLRQVLDLKMHITNLELLKNWKYF